MPAALCVQAIARGMLARRWVASLAGARRQVRLLQVQLLEAVRRQQYLDAAEIQARLAAARVELHQRLEQRRLCPHHRAAVTLQRVTRGMRARDEADRRRVAWFHEEQREAARRIQVLILTLTLSRAPHPGARIARIALLAAIAGMCHRAVHASSPALPALPALPAFGCGRRVIRA